MTVDVLSRMTVGVLSRMTVTSLCRSTLDSEPILSFCTTLFVIPVTYLSFRAIAGIQEAFLSFNIREKNNIDSPLLISGITENENNKKRKKTLDPQSSWG